MKLKNGGNEIGIGDIIVRSEVESIESFSQNNERIIEAEGEKNAFLY